MDLLVVGGGGREHAIIKKLRENDKVEHIYALPGNGGIAADADRRGSLWAAVRIDSVILRKKKGGFYYEKACKESCCRGSGGVPVCDGAGGLQGQDRP